jgi:hypothetical protein
LKYSISWMNSELVPFWFFSLRSKWIFLGSGFSGSLCRKDIRAIFQVWEHSPWKSSLYFPLLLAPFLPLIFTSYWSHWHKGRLLHTILVYLCYSSVSYSFFVFWDNRWVPVCVSYVFCFLTVNWVLYFIMCLWWLILFVHLRGSWATQIFVFGWDYHLNR